MKFFILRYIINFSEYFSLYSTAMTFSTDIISNLIYELKPHGLFLIDRYYKYFKDLSPKNQHKYVCTLCDYTIQLLHFLCIRTGCYCNKENGFLTTNDVHQIANLLLSSREEKILLVIGYSYEDSGHIFGFIIDHGECFKIESSLDDFSAQMKKITPDDIIKELFWILKFSFIEIKIVPIPSDEVLINNAKMIIETPIPPRMINLYNLLTDPDYPTYDYYET